MNLFNTSSGNKRSLRSLYAGVSGPLLTTGAIASVNFALYDTFRRILYYDDKGNNNCSGARNGYLYHDSLFNVAVSSTSAGAIISFATSPLMVVKTKQQLMLWSMKKAAKDTLVHKGGFRNFYAGFGAHFICDGIGRGVYFTTYEYLKRLIIKRNGVNAAVEQSNIVVNGNDEPASIITVVDRMACAALAGMACWAVIFPFDTIRSKMYAKAALLPNRDVCPSCTQLAMETWKKGGFRLFFKGFTITILRAGPVASVVLPIYDLTLDWLKQA